MAPAAHLNQRRPTRDQLGLWQSKGVIRHHASGVDDRNLRLANYSRIWKTYSSRKGPTLRWSLASPSPDKASKEAASALMMRPGATFVTSSHAHFDLRGPCKHGGLSLGLDPQQRCVPGPVDRPLETSAFGQGDKPTGNLLQTLRSTHVPAPGTPTMSMEPSPGQL